MLLSLLSSGCQEPAAPFVPEPLTPAERFDAVVDRLKRMLKDRTTSDGLIVRSQIEHKMDEPKSGEDNPTAEVKITTKRLFIHSAPATSKPSTNDQSDEAKQPEGAGDAEIPGAATDEVYSGGAPSVVRDTETKTYQLTFIDGLWQLNSNPETISEQLLFKSALISPE